MIRTVKLLAVILVILVSVFAFISCTELPKDPSITDDEKPTDKPQDPDKDDNTDIVVPDYKDYDRNAVDYSTIEYKRPDIDEIIKEFERVTEEVTKSESSAKELLASIKSLEPLYNSLTTARAVVMHKFARNPYHVDWISEYTYVENGFAAFSKAVEELFAAASRSSYKKELEEGYFGNGTLKSYYSGAVYTDEFVKLIKKEIDLEVKYRTLTTSSVTILYKGITDDAQSIISYYDGAPDIPKILEIYKMERSRAALSIYVDLLMTRKLIAMHLDRENYSDIFYDSQSYGYNVTQEMSSFIKSIEEYAVPLYTSLYISVFNDYFRTSSPQKMTPTQVINQLYDLYKETDSDFADVLSYMIQYGLFDIGQSGRARENGTSFTSYLEEYDSPFLFATLDGDVSDLGTVSSEFGNYYDAYVNRGITHTGELAGFTSKGLALITLANSKGIIDSDDYKYLTFKMMQKALLELLTTACFSRFETEAYELGYYEITELKLLKLAEDAIYDFRLGIPPESIITQRLIEQPLYYRSECTSSLLSFELFFGIIDGEDRLSGFKALVDRTKGAPTLKEATEALGISSPLSDETVKRYTDKIYYYIVGAHYYKEFVGAGN